MRWDILFSGVSQALSMPQDDWPPYRVGNKEHMHALGVIASVFNLLEFRFRALFQLYLEMPFLIAATLFGKISNVERLQLIDLAVTRSSHPETIKADVRYFLAGYRNCNDNRNILMHSMAMFVWFDPNAERCPVVSPKQPDAIAFQKSKRDDSHKINIYRPTITELREVADALKSFETYGDDLYWHILKNYEPTIYESWGFPKGGQHSLPGRPALPKLLTPLPADIEGI